jgi:tetratricopeptide (TPR) repeat protein
MANRYERPIGRLELIMSKRVYNPYDFANPVSDTQIFAGRRKELDDIIYYLDHARDSVRPINIALIGARAAGKTSFLNMAEKEALNRNFLTVRLDLDEGSVASELLFFHKIFDCIFNAAIDAGAFGGSEGKTFDTYLDLVSTYDVPDDKEFCPCVFPILYAKALASNNPNAVISDPLFKKDLVRIREEVGKPIILLFDECNVLSSKRILLEKLRNIFMNNPGYMLFLTGTPDLFPVIDDVFSPIIRQFKKIVIGEFKDVKETRECILNPLSKLGNLDDFISREFESDIPAIHDLTAGKPYEIQLICHFMFRKSQNYRTRRRLNFSLSILEEIRKELELSQDSLQRPIFNTISRLTNDELQALSQLTGFNGGAKFEDIWALLATVEPMTSAAKEILAKHLNSLIALNILSINDYNEVVFVGDEFDKTYVKYYARQRKISYVSSNRDFAQYAIWRLERAITGESEDIFVVIDNGNIFIKNLTDESKDANPSYFQRFGPLADEIYRQIFYHREDNFLSLMVITMDLPWVSTRLILMTNVPWTEEKWDKLLTAANEVSQRGAEHSLTISSEVVQVHLPSIDTAIDEMSSIKDKVLLSRLFDWHTNEMVRLYAEEKNLAPALLHGELASRLPGECNSQLENNLGYLSLAQKQYNKAKYHLTRAIDCGGPVEIVSIASYNLGVIFTIEGNVSEAFRYFENVREVLESRPHYCACLFVPKLDNGSFQLNEVFNIDLTEVVNDAIAALPHKPNTSS